MNWEVIAATGEWAGAIAVVITLAYLAKQIKQAREVGQFNASKELFERFDEINQLLITNPETRQLLIGSGELTPDEEEHLYTVANLFCNQWASVEEAFNQGQISEQMFSALIDDVPACKERWPRIVTFIEKWLHNYPGFRNFRIFETFQNDA